MTSETIQLTRKFCLDKFTFDADAAITETAEFLTVEPVTLVREGVYPYDDGQALKPGDELAKAARVSRLYIAWDHPPLRVITRPQEIKGFVDGVHAQKDNKGVKVKGRLSFDKTSLTQDQLELIRSKIRRDVSLGFYYTEDRTPGSWNGQSYDYIQRDFVFDHVASVDHGRCPFPQCGIGVDAGSLAQGTKIGNDPYPNEHACRIMDPATCHPESFRRMKSGRVSLILARPKAGGKMTLQAIRYPKSTWTAAAAKADCKKHSGQFAAATSDQSDNVMTKEEDVPGSQKFPATDVNLRPAGENPEENCDHCIFYDWIKKQDCSIVEGPISGNMICDEFTGKPTLERWVLGVQRGNASETQDGAGVDVLTAEQKNKIPRSEWGYAPGDNRSEWKLPLPDRAHVIAALQALQGARGGVTIPRAALPGVKRKVCSFARKDGIKSAYCGTADSAVDMLSEIKNLDTVDLIRLHKWNHDAEDYVPEGLLDQCIVRELTKRKRER